MHNLLMAIAAALPAGFAAVLFGKDVQCPAAAVTLVTTAETVVQIGAAMPVPNATGKAAVTGFVTLTIGTNTTAVTLRLYRGTSASGTLIGTAVAQAGNFTAGSPANFFVVATDTLTNVGSAQYTLTVQQTAASANGSVTTAKLDTEVLSG